MYLSCELKFEQTAEVGDVIKAFDFMPGRPDCPDTFILGVVKSKGWISDFDYKAYVVECIYDTNKRRVGREVLVPFETSMDYDNRVTKV